MKHCVNIVRRIAAINRRAGAIPSDTNAQDVGCYLGPGRTADGLPQSYYWQLLFRTTSWDLIETAGGVEFYDISLLAPIPGAHGTNS